MNIPLFIIILIISKSNSGKAEDTYLDMLNCAESDTNSCTSVSLKTKNLLCCRISVETEHNDEDYNSDDDEDYNSDDDEDSDACAPVHSDFFSDGVKESIEALIREEFGVARYWEVLGYIDYKFTTKYECKDKSVSLVFGGQNYTNSEIEILKADNNCYKLYYHSIGDYYGIEKKSIVKNDCMNAKILDSTKNAKISCGYSEFTIIWSDDTKTEFKSCFYLTQIAIKAKQLDSETLKNLNKIQIYFSSQERKIVKSYKVKITDGDGNVLNYDSATGTVSNSNFIKVKSLFLLILLSFVL